MQSLEEFDVKEMYVQLKSRLASFLKRLHHFECSHDAGFKMCQLELRFQNLPFSKSAGKNVPFSCEREAYPSHSSPFSKCVSFL